MQDRSYAIAIVVVLAICCLGVYVAVSGYMNSNIPLSLSGSTTPGVESTLVVVIINTETPPPTGAGTAIPPIPTSVPPALPLGAIQTLVIAPTSAPGGNPAPASTTVPLPPPPPLPVPSATTVPQTQSCTTPYCAKGGPPDANLGPGGIECPNNYIFGRVVDRSGKGLTDRTIRFIGPSGESGSLVTKGPPDPPGSFNIPTGPPGNTYKLWLTQGGGIASPQVSVTTKTYPGGGNCPNRVDFVQQ